MKLTLEQHIEFGEQVKQFREALIGVICAGKRNSQEARAVWAALRYVDILRKKMDRIACRDFPEFEDCTKIYSGLDVVVNSEPCPTCGTCGSYRKIDGGTACGGCGCDLDEKRRMGEME